MTRRVLSGRVESGLVSSWQSGLVWSRRVTSCQGSRVLSCPVASRLVVAVEPCLVGSRRVKSSQVVAVMACLAATILFLRFKKECDRKCDRLIRAMTQKNESPRIRKSTRAFMARSHPASPGARKRDIACNRYIQLQSGRGLRPAPFGRNAVYGT